MGRLKQTLRQNEGGLKWAENDFKGIVNWCTAVGKSFFTVYRHPDPDEAQGLIQRYLNSYPDNNILVVLHDKINRDQWVRKLNGFRDKVDKQIKLITMDGLASVVADKPLDLEGGLLIIDEIHKLTSNLKRKIWDGTNIIYEHILGLTGTEELITKYAPSLYDIAPIVDTIALAEANELGFIANSNYTVIVQTLDPEKRKEYDEYSKYIRAAINRNNGKLSELYKFTKAINRNWENPDFDLSKLNSVQLLLRWLPILLPKGKAGRGGCFVKTPKAPHGEWKTNEDWINLLAKMNGYSDDLDDFDPMDKIIINEWNPTDLQTYVIKLHEAWYNRPKLLQTHEDKLEVAYRLLKLKNFTRSVIFSESTQFVDDLCDLINERQGEEVAVKYHSKVKIQARNKDGSLRTMKRRKDLKKYAKKIDEPVYGTDSKGKYLEVPVYMGVDKVMAYNKSVLDKLPENKGAYIFCKSGDTGFDDPLISFVLVTSYSNSSTVGRQREGRGLRLNPNDMKLNKDIIYLAFEDTYEMSKMANLAEGLVDNGIYVDWTTYAGYCDEDVDLSKADITDITCDSDEFDLSILI